MDTSKNDGDGDFLISSSSTTLPLQSIRKRQTATTSDTPVKNVKFDENIKIHEICSRDSDESSSYEATSTPSNPRSLANLCWFIASIAVFYYSDLYNVLFYDQNQIHRKLAYGALILIATNILIGLYMIVWLTHLKKINSDLWSTTHPFLIPIATGAFVFGTVLLTIAIWPVYGFLTFPILFTIFMGFIVVIINIPPWF